MQANLWLSFSHDSSIANVEDEILGRKFGANFGEFALGFLKAIYGFDPDGLAIRQPHENVKVRDHCQTPWCLGLNKMRQGERHLGQKELTALVRNG